MKNIKVKHIGSPRSRAERAECGRPQLCSPLYKLHVNSLACHNYERSELIVAGLRGIEPLLKVLETSGLPLTYRPKTSRLH